MAQSKTNETEYDRLNDSPRKGEQALFILIYQVF